jgi:tRNA-dihydrouridine synthase C
MREQLTAIGGYERCVTEFVRVSQTLLPKRVFYRYAPKLKQGGVDPIGRAGLPAAAGL